jgi:hypothetical protein
MGTGAKGNQHNSSSRSRRGIALAVIGLFVAALVLSWFIIRVGDSADSSSAAVSGSLGSHSLGASANLFQSRSDMAVSPVSVEGLNPRQTLVDQLAARSDAHTDDWDTEVLNEAIGGQLKELGELLKHSDQIQRSSTSRLVNGNFRCTELRPDALEEVFQDESILVRRWSPAKTSSESESGSNAKSYDTESQGPHRLVNALRQLVRPLGKGGEVHAKFKVFEIEKKDVSIKTRLYFEASNRNANGAVQQTATWICVWTHPNIQGDGQLPQLSSIELAAYEEAVLRDHGGHLFVDCTESVLGGNAAYRDQVLPGINHWLTRIGREFMGQFGQHGITVGDVNGDGLDDVYVCDAGGLPNRLYVQQSDGTAIDVSRRSGVDFLDDSVGALLVDLDNDGDQDLVVATDPLLQFAENDGQGHFALRGGYHAFADIYSLCAADYDNDGDLDIYACGYNARKQDPVNRGLPFPLPYHDAENGGGNILLSNTGGFVFHDVTQETGLAMNNSRFSLAASWEDYDNDGDQDLYVANDFGRNCLYRNERGQFNDVAQSAAVEDRASGMSVSWGDYNRDGWMDIYVSNMFSAAGNRVTYQRKFSAGITEQTASGVRRMARGNSLFANPGNAGARFRDVSESSAVTLGRWAWASRFVDLNNDGWLDLAIANGYVTNEDKDDL